MSYNKSPDDDMNCLIKIFTEMAKSNNKKTFLSDLKQVTFPDSGPGWVLKQLFGNPLFFGACFIGTGIMDKQKVPSSMLVKELMEAATRLNEKEGGETTKIAAEVLSCVAGVIKMLPVDVISRMVDMIAKTDAEQRRKPKTPPKDENPEAVSELPSASSDITTLRKRK